MDYTICENCSKKYLCYTTELPKYFVLRQPVDIETVKSRRANTEERYDLAYDLQPVIIHNAGEPDAEVHDNYSYTKNGAEQTVEALNSQYPYFNFSIVSAMCKYIIAEEYLLLPEV